MHASSWWDQDSKAGAKHNSVTDDHHARQIAPCFASITAASSRPQPVTTAPAAKPASSGEKTITDVVAGAVARAASQSTIHPIDTIKVRLQAGHNAGPRSPTVPGAGAFRGFRVNAATAGMETPVMALRQGLHEVLSLYKGVLSAATGAGIIIGAYFACYSTAKRYLKEHTDMTDGTVAFVAGATAAVGSSVVKVPIAVCIRSVQAGVYPNAIHAAKSITKAAGLQGLFTGFLPTLLEDAPDMAVKFAVYETLRPLHRSLVGGRDPTTAEDLLMGGSAGAAAAAATTPLDVVKTRMMCTASSRPTIVKAVRDILAEGEGARAFFRGVGPRALSNGLNSAVFFCFFEAIRRVLIEREQEAAMRRLQPQVEIAELPAGSEQQHRPQEGASSSGSGSSKRGRTSVAASLTLALQERRLSKASSGDLSLWQQPLQLWC